MKALRRVTKIWTTIALAAFMAAARAAGTGCSNEEAKPYDNNRELTERLDRMEREMAQTRQEVNDLREEMMAERVSETASVTPVSSPSSYCD